MARKAWDTDWDVLNEESKTCRSAVSEPVPVVWLIVALRIASGNGQLEWREWRELPSYSVLLVATLDSRVLGTALSASQLDDVQLCRHVEIGPLKLPIETVYYHDIVFVDRLPRCPNSYRDPSSRLRP